MYMKHNQRMEGECGPDHFGSFCLNQCHGNGFETSYTREEFFSGDSLSRVERGIKISEDSFW